MQLNVVPGVKVCITGRKAAYCTDNTCKSPGTHQYGRACTIPPCDYFLKIASGFNLDIPWGNQISLTGVAIQAG